MKCDKIEVIYWYYYKVWLIKQKKDLIFFLKIIMKSHHVVICVENGNWTVVCAEKVEFYCVREIHYWINGCMIFVVQLNIIMNYVMIFKINTHTVYIY